MRYLLIVALLVTLLTGCGADETVMKISNDSEAKVAMSVARLNRCTNCHGVSHSIFGPAWNLVSERYKDMPREEVEQWLVEKVKKGGSGSWNDITGGAEMPPQGNLVSDAHIRQIVKFIVSLKRDDEKQTTE